MRCRLQAHVICCGAGVRHAEGAVWLQPQPIPLALCAPRQTAHRLPLFITPSPALQYPANLTANNVVLAKDLSKSVTDVWVVSPTRMRPASVQKRKPLHADGMRLTVLVRSL